ncbi:MAG: energy-coupled thiamine transporter ThiT [Ruminococcus sp.]|nr:energy-coupled thiamine transporter ThiT [Ruminococcus sp.]
MSKTQRENPMKDVKLTQKLTETGLMLALAVILSVVKIAELPYGGSITLASMLPLIVISYRYGVGWGSLTGLVFGLIQMIIGMNNVSYATSVIAAVAIILLDYLFAFTAVCLGGLFRRMANQSAAFFLSALAVCFVRYAFHVISGCTVWAGLSIPTTDAFFYSLIYNGTYMLPETIITVVAAIYLGTVLDFSSPRLRQNNLERIPLAAHVLNVISGLLFVAAIAAVVAMIFPKMQNAETGTFDITGITAVNTTALIIVAAVALIVICALQMVKLYIIRNAKQS